MDRLISTVARMARQCAVAAVAMCVMAMTPFVAGAETKPPPLELYGTLPKTEQLRLSPNGKMFAAAFTEGDARMIAVFKTDGTALVTGKIGERRVSRIDWAGDDHVIIYTTFKLLGTETDVRQPLLVKVSTASVQPLVAESRQLDEFVRGVYGYFEEDGIWYAYVALLGGSEVSLYKVNLDTRLPTRLSKLDGSELVLDEKGKIVASSIYNDRTRTWEVYRADDTVLVKGKANFGFDIAGLGRTPGTILVNLDGDEDRLVEIKMADGSQEDLLPAGSELIYSPHTRLLIGAIRPNEKRRMVMYEPILERRLESISRAFKGAELTISSVSADLSKILVFVEDRDVPGNWQLVDFTTGQSNPVAETYPGISADMIGPTRIFNYKAADGLALEGILTLPPGNDGKNLPVVVMPHGGPQASDRPGFDPWAQAFASRGYAVFQPNFRGSAGYGKEFRDAGFGEWGRKMQTDISDGLAALAAEGIVDAKRACIVGASYGGYAAMAGVTVQQGLYRCAASYSGVSDPADMLREEAVVGASYAARRYWKTYIGVSPQGKHPTGISPRDLAARADAPLLLAYGEKDGVVQPHQSKAMASALQRAGKPVELIELKNEDHHLSHAATRLQWFKAMVEFVQKYNPV